MTYHINVSKTNIKEFIAIMHQLSSLGVVESINSTKDLVTEGEKLDADTLNNILNNSREEIKDGKSFSMEDVKKQINSWKRK